jgi:hypothetical protein
MEKRKEEENNWWLGRRWRIIYLCFFMIDLVSSMVMMQNDNTKTLSAPVSGYL